MLGCQPVLFLSFLDHIVKIFLYYLIFCEIVRPLFLRYEAVVCSLLIDRFKLFKFDIAVAIEEDSSSMPVKFWFFEILGAKYCNFSHFGYQCNFLNSFFKLCRDLFLLRYFLIISLFRYCFQFFFYNMSFFIIFTTFAFFLWVLLVLDGIFFLFLFFLLFFCCLLLLN